MAIIRYTASADNTITKLTMSKKNVEYHMSNALKLLRKSLSKYYKGMV